LHFKMHCALGIMRVGEDYLIPLAKELGYASINKKDFKLEDWSQHDSFLMVVGEAAVVWLHNLLPNKMKQLPFDEIMSKISTNKHVSFLYDVVVVNIFDSYHATSFVTLIGLLCTYAELRYAVRENNIQRVDKIWRAFLPVFRATNKTHYAFLSIYTRFVVKHAHQSIKDVLRTRLVSLRGLANHHIGPDCLTEKINHEGRYDISNNTDFNHIIIFIEWE